MLTIIANQINFVPLLLLKRWVDQSKYDLDTARSLYRAKRYIYTIFMCHLAIEKILKALVVKQTGQPPPKTHNLINLMKLGNAKLTDEQVKFVSRLSLAGIVTRYPDELNQGSKGIPAFYRQQLLKVYKGSD